jgi:LPS-assembly protein
MTHGRQSGGWLRRSRAALAIGSLASLLALVLDSGAAAQEAPPAQDPAAPPPAQTTEASEDSISFSADALNYDSETDTVTATGNVEMDREAWRLRADAVRWNRRSGEVVATGNVALTSPEGDTAFGESVTLTDSLRDGIVENLLVAFDNGGRLAATRGERLANGDMAVDRAVYSPCPVEDAEGCARRPSWQVRAVRVYYDRARSRLRYTGARIEIFGMPLIPLPGLSHSIGSAPGTGFLVPDIRYDRVNGVELAVPYYWSIDDSTDATLTPHIYSDAAPMIEAEMRRLTARGAWRARGFATVSNATNAATGAGNDAFRGYIDATAGFQFSPRWSLTASGRVASDRTFLRRYDISRDDRLRSTFSLNRVTRDSFLTIQGWATQTLRLGDSQGQQPVALPLIDYRHRIPDAPLGAVATLHLNTLALTRTNGQDTQRAFASAQWDWRRITGLGQELTVTLLGRGDLYHTDNILATPVPSYRGNSGFQGRAFAAGAVDLRWPFIGPLGRGTQRLTPRVQLALVSPVDNLDIPNEDSRAFELEDGNIFALNRFPGADRFEDGGRITYGLEWNYTQPGLAIDATIAQSYRLGDRASIFPEGTGLTDNASDIVGRTTIAWRNSLRLIHRFRLDEDSLAIRRNEFDATVGSRQTYVIVGYSRLNRNIASFGEDLRDREEVRLGGRVQVARYWSIFGSTILDLTDRREDPLSTADGFEPVRHRLGVAYEDDCLTIGFTWRRDYQDSGDARRGNSFQLRLVLRNLGV